MFCRRDAYVSGKRCACFPEPVRTAPEWAKRPLVEAAVLPLWLAVDDNELQIIEHAVKSLTRSKDDPGIGNA